MPYKGAGASAIWAVSSSSAEDVLAQVKKR